VNHPLYPNWEFDKIYSTYRRGLAEALFDLQTTTERGLNVYHGHLCGKFPLLPLSLPGIVLSTIADSKIAPPPQADLIASIFISK
jgi:hypothetical protein